MNLRTVFGSVAVLAAAVGCSSSGGAYGGGGSTSAAGPTSAAVTISMHGGDLVGVGDRTIYVNSADTTAHVICTGSCLSAWPPVSGKPQAGAGVDAAKLGSFTRPDGTVQATYGGHPLYEFAADKSAGDAKGKGITDAGGTWEPAAASGAGSAPAPSSGRGPGGGGYGG